MRVYLNRNREDVEIPKIAHRIGEDIPNRIVFLEWMGDFKQLANSNKREGISAVIVETEHLRQQEVHLLDDFLNMMGVAYKIINENTCEIAIEGYTPNIIYFISIMDFVLESFIVKDNDKFELEWLLSNWQYARVLENCGILRQIIEDIRNRYEHLSEDDIREQFKSLPSNFLYLLFLNYGKKKWGESLDVTEREDINKRMKEEMDKYFEEVFNGEKDSN